MSTMDNLNKPIKDIEKKAVKDLTALEIIILGETSESAQMAGAAQFAYMSSALEEARVIIQFYANGGCYDGGGYDEGTGMYWLKKYPKDDKK